MSDSLLPSSIHPQPSSATGTGDPAAVPSAQTPVASRRRAFFSRFATTVALWLIIGSAIYFQNGVAFFVLVSVFSLASLWEYFQMLGEDLAPKPYRNFGMTLSLVYLGVNFWWCQTYGRETPFAMDVAALAIAVQGVFWVCYRYPLEGERTLLRIFALVFGFAYITLCFSFVTRLTYFNGVTPEGLVPGVYFTLYLLAVTKFADVGAYTVGSLIGKHKMVPHISPGKTWQGLGGAFLGSLLVSLGLIALFPTYLQPLDFRHGVILAFLLGGSGIGGDLAESVIKRCLKRKDSGHLLPGIGGVLDLTDSLFFTAPVLYFYLHFLSN